MNRLILASSSPRRKSLLESIGYHPYKIVVPNIDEEPFKKELPVQLVERLAIDKATKIAEDYPDDIVLAADTVKARGRLIISKPKDKPEAVKFLKMLSGRRHTVYTGVCVAKGEKRVCKIVQTKVKMKLLTDEEIKCLIQSNEWRDKAGAYALQGVGGAYISWINGSSSNVRGLPVHEVYKILNGLGLKQRGLDEQYSIEN